MKLCASPHWRQAVALKSFYIDLTYAYIFMSRIGRGRTLGSGVVVVIGTIHYIRRDLPSDFAPTYENPVYRIHHNKTVLAAAATDNSATPTAWNLGRSKMCKSVAADFHRATRYSTVLKTVSCGGR